MKTTPRFSKSFPLAAVLAMLVALAAIFFVAAAAQNAPQAPLLVLISVDGMRPDYVTAADAHGAKIPNLRRGELPELPDLRASFFFMGPGIARAHALSVIDMRDVAPTLAHAVHLPFSSADGKNLIP